MSGPEGRCWFAGADAEEDEDPTTTAVFSNDWEPCGRSARWHGVVAAPEEPGGVHDAWLCDEHLAQIVTEAPTILLEVNAR